MYQISKIDGSRGKSWLAVLVGTDNLYMQTTTANGNSIWRKRRLIKSTHMVHRSELSLQHNKIWWREDHASNVHFFCYVVVNRWNPITSGVMNIEKVGIFLLCRWLVLPRIFCFSRCAPQCHIDATCCINVESICDHLRNWKCHPRCIPFETTNSWKSVRTNVSLVSKRRR